jgi:transposase
MENVHFIGVDISKKTLDFAVCKEGKTIFSEQCPNNKKSIAAMLKRIGKLEGFVVGQAVLCMEKTGIYNNPLLNYLSTSKIKVWLESPQQIKHSMGITRGKSDIIDAARIAKYSYIHQREMQVWKPARNVIVQLKQLNTMRERLVKTLQQLTIAITEGEEFLDKKIASLEKKLFKSSITAMKNDLKRIDEEISKVIDSDPKLKKLYRLVTSVDFVGPVVACAVIAVTEEFTTYTDPKKFACHCGVAPFEHTSGSSVRGRTKVSKKADMRLKKLLHLAAVSSTARPGELREYYNRKKAEGHSAMSVLNAIRNKIVHRIFAVVKRGTEFTRDYQNALA